MNEIHHRPTYGINKKMMSTIILWRRDYHQSMAPRYAQKGDLFRDPPANKALDEDWDGDREDREADGELGRKKN